MLYINTQVIKKKVEKYLDCCKCKREPIKKSNNLSNVLIMQQFHQIYNKMLISDEVDGEEDYILSGKYVEYKLIDEDDLYKDNQ